MAYAKWWRKNEEFKWKNPPQLSLYTEKSIQCFKAEEISMQNFQCKLYQVSQLGFCINMYMYMKEIYEEMARNILSFLYFGRSWLNMKRNPNESTNIMLSAYLQLGDTIFYVSISNFPSPGGIVYALKTNNLPESKNKQYLIDCFCHWGPSRIH